MTALDVTLTPAQWEHWDRHGWTLVAAPTEPCGSYESVKLRAQHEDGASLSDIADRYGITRERVRQLVMREHPVPATEPCPNEWCDSHHCLVCSGSGVVPRTVGIIRPERTCEKCGGYGRLRGDWDDASGWVWIDCACLAAWEATHGVGDGFPSPMHDPTSTPAEQVGTATVTPVPVVDVNGPWPQNEGARFVTVGDGLVMLYTADRDADEGYDGEDLSGYGPTDPPLFATPPNPGTTVWRLDKENNDA